MPVPTFTHEGKRYIEGFHFKDGWFFKRQEDGSVHIYHVPPGFAGAGDEAPEADAEVVIDFSSWASVVASVSSTGETSQSYQIASALHGAGYQPKEERPLSDATERPLASEAE